MSAFARWSTIYCQYQGQCGRHLGALLTVYGLTLNYKLIVIYNLDIFTQKKNSKNSDDNDDARDDDGNNNSVIVNVNWAELWVYA